MSTTPNVLMPTALSWVSIHPGTKNSHHFSNFTLACRSSILWDTGAGFSSYQEALDYLAQQPFARSEAQQILKYSKERIEHPSILLDDPHGQVPLRVHSTYTRAEALTAIGQTSITGPYPRNHKLEPSGAERQT